MSAETEVVFAELKNPMIQGNRVALFSARDSIFRSVKTITDELQKVLGLHTQHYNSAHEAYGVLAEEVDEVLDELRRITPRGSQHNRHEAICHELAQVAAVCIRAIASLQDRP